MKSAFFKHHYRVRATHGDTLGSEYGKKNQKSMHSKQGSVQRNWATLEEFGDSGLQSWHLTGTKKGKRQAFYKSELKD